jgi:hypothetical protein
VILVIAGDGDAGAEALVAELAPLPATAVGCLDFVAGRSSLRHPDFDASTLTVGGCRLSVGAITGVVNALAAVVPAALTVYDVEEREYQAAELHALLVYFLTALRCPVINRPSRLGLVGPVLNPLGWFHLARAAGLPVVVGEVTSEDPATARAAASRGNVEARWAEGMIPRNAAEQLTAALARRCGLGYLEARYEDGSGGLRFAGARSVPDLASRETRRALATALAT